MTPDLIFQLSCGLAAVGWIIILCVSPFWKGWDRPVVGIVIALLALVYTYLNFSNFSVDNLKHFSSLAGVEMVFQNRDLLTAAWVHFLVMDLLAAVWMKRNSLLRGMKHWTILPALFFTCMLGPLGFLIYLLTRWIATKKYFADNGG